MRERDFQTQAVAKRRVKDAMPAKPHQLHQKQRRDASQGASDVFALKQQLDEQWAKVGQMSLSLDKETSKEERVRKRSQVC